MQKDTINLNPRKSTDFTKISLFLKEIKSIISSHKNTYDAQLKIEENWLEIARNTYGLDSHILKSQGDLINQAYEYLSLRLKSRGRRIKLPFIEELNDIKWVALSFSLLLVFHKKNSSTSIVFMIADYIIYSIWRKSKNSSTISIDDFKRVNNIDDTTRARIGNLFADLFVSEYSPNQIFVSTVDESEYGQLKYSLNNEYLEEVLDSIIIKPQSLPMISTPNLWSEKSYGGFLENAHIKKELVTGSSYHDHKLLMNDNLYKAINYLNSLQFTVNKDLLEYISNKGQYLINHFREIDPKNYINLITSLQVAEVYKNSIFYLNTNIDWRSRIYTNSFYMTYQGSEYSLALINLAKGQVLTESGITYLYIYGSNCYNYNNLDKAPFKDRIEWVKNNLDKIYSMDRDFILKAEKPFLFAAFCLALKSLRDNPKSKINFPVFLDATCSGIQHFAGMLMDYDLASEVNLTKSNLVKDIYSKLVEPINNNIHEFANSNILYSHFKDIKLSRKELKKVIMTKTYNVSLFGITDQLKSSAEKVESTIPSPKNPDKEIKIFNYNFPSTKRNKKVLLSDSEVFKLAEIINKSIFKAYPSLYSIYLFLTKLTKVMIKFNIPVSWATPTGLIITQHYRESEIKKISLSVLGKNKTIVLRNWIEKSLDKRKQVNAIIPNIIHSFDASHLIEIINAVSLKSMYILPIHDCYGTHPNDMDKIAFEVRLQFIKIYSQENFLKKIRDKVIFELKSHSIDIKIDPEGNEYVDFRIAEKRFDKIIIPKAPQLGNYNVNDLIKAEYMIC